MLTRSNYSTSPLDDTKSVGQNRQSTLEGKGVQKYVGRVKEVGRIERRHSSFYIGLYGRNWVNFVKPYEDLVTKLMILNRNKRPFYQRGLRAMELILASS